MTLRVNGIAIKGFLLIMFASTKKLHRIGCIIFLLDLKRQEIIKLKVLEKKLREEEGTFQELE